MPIFHLKQRPGKVFLRRLAGLASAGCSLLLGPANGRTADFSAVHDPSGNLTLIAANSGQPPVISSFSHNAVASVGGIAAFSVTASGSEVLGYQWFFNSKAVAGATGDSLPISYVDASNFGAYYAVVTNAFGSATSAVARLDLDADHDGLADSWEMNYFGSLTNQTGAFDRDHDGIDNITEYLEGTNPTNALSILPRLTVVPYRCAVTINPLLEKYTNGQSVTLTATPNAGQTFIGWFGATNSTSNVVTIVMTTSKTVIAQAGLPLAASVDVTNRVVTGGDVAWYGEAEDTHDGVDAARSGRMTNNQTSWFQMTNTLSGEGTVSFWWKASSQANYDFLKCLINGVQKPGQISGITDWQLRTYYLTSGVPVVRWEFTKSSNDGQVSDGITLNSDASRTNFYAAGPWPGVAPLDAAWVDQVVFQPYANPLLDTDGNGLPDLWQYRFFYALGQSPSADPDNDGINNLDEYLDGTDPTVNSSQKPRLTVISEGAGTLSANPNKPKYNYGESVTNTALPAINNFFVMWTGAVFDTNTTTRFSMTGSRTLKGVFGFALDQALEAPNLTWARGGVVGWYGQTNITHDGVDAAQSAPITSNGESWMETTVTGPGSLSFWWRVSSLTNANTLRLNVDTVEQAHRISGEVDWEPQFFNLGAGTHTFRWRFFRNNYSTNHVDAGWVDQVTFTPGAVAPNLLLQPISLTVLQGTNVTLTAFAAGTPTLMYDWQRNGVSLIPLSTNASITISNITLAQGGGGYSVHASNASGTNTNSVPFTITVLPVPPVNDDFAGRLLISTLDETVFGYNFGATAEPGEPDPSGFGGPSHSVWWAWSPPQSGTARLNALGTSFSPVIAIYRGATMAGLTPIASIVAGTQLDFPVTNGVSYALAFDGLSGRMGNIQFTVGFLAAAINSPVKLLDGAIQIAFSGFPGGIYAIETSTDLVAWSHVLTITLPASGMGTFTNSTSLTDIGRFYRIVAQ